MRLLGNLKVGRQPRRKSSSHSSPTHSQDFQATMLHRFCSQNTASATITLARIDSQPRTLGYLNKKARLMLSHRRTCVHPPFASRLHVGTLGKWDKVTPCRPQRTGSAATTLRAHKDLSAPPVVHVRDLLFRVILSDGFARREIHWRTKEATGVFRLTSCALHTSLISIARAKKNYFFHFSI